MYGTLLIIIIYGIWTRDNNFSGVSEGKGCFLPGFLHVHAILCKIGQDRPKERNNVKERPLLQILVTVAPTAAAEVVMQISEAAASAVSVGSWKGRNIVERVS